jgi:Ni,Fe-hydrogenase III large subunit/Ni,Fe-hydrogenase III component G
MRSDEIIKKYIPDGLSVRQEGNVFSFAIESDTLNHICKEFYFTHKLPLKIITALDERIESGGFRILYVFGIPGENVFLIPFIVLKNKFEFPSITRDVHEASGYERKIATFFGLKPLGHPDSRPMILHENWPENIFPLRKDFNWRERPEKANGSYQFQKVDGEGIYEIPVGPVHAGIIEPGHFRFSVAGEEIILLEPRLGYKHKGIEKLFEILGLNEKVKLSEKVSGDASFSHSLAFCQAVENLAGIMVPEKAKYLRIIFGEMERLANHLNDIGFIMSDTGYSFGGSNGTRLKEVIMQWNERLTGSRFLRGVNSIGGVTAEISTEILNKLVGELYDLLQDFNEVIAISENSSSLLNRLSGTGKLEKKTATDHGVLGVAGRALGVPHDARIEFPYANYDLLKFDIAQEEIGDVHARLYVRIKEIRTASQIIVLAVRNIADLPVGKAGDKELKTDEKISLKKNSCAIGITEGWRGEIVYLVTTDSLGEISRVDVRDPSFINWPLVGYAGKGNIVPDFPLINKSFNLSYCGNDL